MSSDDMAEVASPLPGVMSRRMKYSLQEQVVGEWIDGKPIYQKTIDFGALPNNTTKNVAHGISNIGNIINAFGIASLNGTFGPMAYVAKPAGNEQSLTIDATNVNIKTIEPFGYTTYAYVTLQYTKTTDTAS